MSPYKGITLAMPGRHAEDTSPKGGDFVVMVTDKNMKWRNHQFTHTDIFVDVELKHNTDPATTKVLLERYLDIVAEGIEVPSIFKDIDGINSLMFLQAVQCLAVAEHRRYHQYEAKFGGRFLPFRFAAGIAEGLWTATDAVDKQKRGRPGVEWLERDHGLPILTKQLMGK